MAEIHPTFCPLPWAQEVPAVGGKGHELGTRRLRDLSAALSHATSWSMHHKSALRCLAGAFVGQSPQSWTRVAPGKGSEKKTNTIYHSLTWPGTTTLPSRVMKPSGNKAQVMPRFLVHTVSRPETYRHFHSHWQPCSSLGFCLHFLGWRCSGDAPCRATVAWAWPGTESAGAKLCFLRRSF